MLTVDAIKTQARALGFDLCGIAPAVALPELTHLRQWLDRGYAGDMVYLHKSADTRADIRNFLPTARSVIVTGTVYYTEPPEPVDGPHAHIARYALGEDYHLVLAERLETLVASLREMHGQPFDAAIFVDKHHVQERVFAKHAGIGWVGKNTCVINPQLGSWLFLAGVAVSLDLPADQPVADHCGACTLCIDSCPTGALVDDYQLDATKCISYLTIELDSAIPEAQRASIGDHLYGCDICQDVCPWNLTPLATLDPAWQPRAGRRQQVDPAELWSRSDFELHGLVEGSAMVHTTMSRLRRNLAVVLGNTQPDIAADLLSRDVWPTRRSALSAATPLVQEHVRWAMAESREPKA
ncbi:MAG TPA: tRNA epoxyqueuosine(34) reductase QueG [Vicinamibacterales bacterium]|nr:tRNA epoxyqueuosine(34) reductase QueG [Vicinamibacterales bacterium]